MHLFYRNVNDGFRGIVTTFKEGTHVVQNPSRNGNVLRMKYPTLITYQNPYERVLFNKARDANPFFHVYEALWMLAGRNDVAPLAYYANQMKEYSDDGKSLNGAYGHRWRYAYTSIEDDGVGLDNKLVDQLQAIIDHLKSNPTSRRAVLSMWNVEDDLLKIDESKDTCCNLNVMFDIREDNDFPYLDMTVTNRSNDAIWGLLGANYVHFSFLQEYMAACIGVGMGYYHHFSNNLHAYDWNFKPDEWLKEYDQHGHDKEMNYPINQPEGYEVRELVRNPDTFNEEVQLFVDQAWGNRPINVQWEEPFIKDVAMPMSMAFCCHKGRDYENAFYWMNHVKATDWQFVGRQWLRKRQFNYERGLYHGGQEGVV
jgi:thymidylate synthase